MSTSKVPIGKRNQIISLDSAYYFQEEIKESVC